MSVETYYRDSWAEIDLSRIQHNIYELKQTLPEQTGIYAVVKANAYGHGDIQVAKAAEAAGVKGFAVALLDEAIRLREEGIKAPILVMGWVRPEDAAIAAREKISLTAFQPEWIEEAGQSLSPTCPLSIHMKWDTGMGRIGIRTVKEMDELLTALDTSLYTLDGVFTHFATADEEDATYFHEQQERFDLLLSAFQERWSGDVEIHTGNSATAMRFPETMNHYVRFGIGMYGLYPSPDVKAMDIMPLEPALSLHSKLIHVKQLPKGEAISYGATYVTSDEEWIGTVPLGYADGWKRSLQGTDVLVNGKRCPIVGKVCMDQIMIRLDQQYPIGTHVTFIGRQEEEEITSDEIAAHLDTINYEVTCMISYRVPRVFVQDGKTIGSQNGAR
ncbi:alanine racemase [Pontibacillus halophilus JSM 076056 = DSM 19796]|uniref:Alanine racemase n=1 Tax=Pontibacillus halophilus JSM 076056 = DSM 19796 TaxID=1385510 RepID=A0A0A5GBM3_9BACI|nr:alanine racemase [Pontibacillus halophilus]KGX90571.1 alanine racemase [Pontibacillus halophilus JSM 076056 = DSM 19796]